MSKLVSRHPEIGNQAVKHAPTVKHSGHGIMFPGPNLAANPRRYRPAQVATTPGCRRSRRKAKTAELASFCRSLRYRNNSAGIRASPRKIPEVLLIFINHTTRLITCPTPIGHSITGYRRNANSARFTRLAAVIFGSAWPARSLS